MRRSKTGAVCMGLGLLLLLGAVGLSGYNVWDEDRAETVAMETVHELRIQTPDLEVLDPQGELIPNYILDPEREMPVIEVDGHDYVGYVSIPALGLSLPVMESWSYPNLKISPCRYKGSAYSNDLIIAAHNYERHFGGLKTLSVGDEVSFTDGDGNIFTYSVAALEQLQPTQVEEMEAGGWDLTLFTCTIGGQQRVTVRCTLKSENAAVS